MFYDEDDEIEIKLIMKTKDELVEMAGRCLTFYHVKALVVNDFHKFTVNVVIKNKMRNLLHVRNGQGKQQATANIALHKTVFLVYLDYS